MDKIIFNTSALEPMLDWLSERKRTGRGDEKHLRVILDLPDYRVEFERYSSPSLPVCGISFEEAVDFFMNFDRKGKEQHTVSDLLFRMLYVGAGRYAFRKRKAA